MITSLSESKQPPLASVSFYNFIIFLFVTSCWQCSVCLTSVIPLLSVAWQATAFCFPSSSLHRNSYWQGHKWLANNQIKGPILVLNLFRLFSLVSVDIHLLSFIPSFFLGLLKAFSHEFLFFNDCFCLLVLFSLLPVFSRVSWMLFPIPLTFKPVKPYYTPLYKL